MNKLIILGRLTRDPELSYTPKGTALCKISVAVNRKFKDQDGNRQTDFFDCKAFGKTAEFIQQYFTKGDSIAVDGPMHRDTWTDKEGNKRFSWECIVDAAYFTGGKKDGGNNSGYASQDIYAEDGGF